MMTSDYVTGRLNWNTVIVEPGLLREAKGKGPKKPKAQTAAESADVRKPKSVKNSLGDLDELIYKMESKELLPDAPKGKGVVARGTSGRGTSGRGTEGRGKQGYGPGDYGGLHVTAPSKFDARTASLDELAAKYGLPTVKPKRSYARRS
jgi:hypothetical protein